MSQIQHASFWIALHWSTFHYSAFSIQSLLSEKKNPDLLTRERRTQKSTAPETNERGNRRWLQKKTLLHPLISLCVSLSLTLNPLLTSWPSASVEKSPVASRLPWPVFAAAAQCQSLTLSLSCTQLRASSHSQETQRLDDGLSLPGASCTYFLL